MNKMPLAPVRSVVKTDNHTEYNLLGFPYTGQMYHPGDPNGRDFHGTRFTPDTEIGEWLLSGRSIPVYWEHGWGELGRSLLGEAVIGEETEDGRLLKVIIERANRYHDMLAELESMGYLRGSGQALSSMYDEDRDGLLTIFHPGEYSLTVEPSNVEAMPTEVVQRIRNIYGIDLLKGNSMAVKKNTRSVDTDQNIQKTDVVLENSTEEVVEEVSHAAELEQIFAEADAAAAPEVTEVEAVDVSGLMAEVRSLTGMVEELLQEVRDLRDGNRVMAEQIARRLPQVAAQMGAGERDVYTRAAQQPAQPIVPSGPRPATSGLTPPVGGRR